jgi:hypothetical protein
VSKREEEGPNEEESEVKVGNEVDRLTGQGLIRKAAKGEQVA